MFAVLSVNQLNEPEKMLSTPIAAMNRPMILVTTPRACSPTAYIRDEDILRIAHVAIRAMTPATATVSMPYCWE